MTPAYVRIIEAMSDSSTVVVYSIQDRRILCNAYWDNMSTSYFKETAGLHIYVIEHKALPKTLFARIKLWLANIF